MTISRFFLAKSTIIYYFCRQKYFFADADKDPFPDGDNP